MSCILTRRELLLQSAATALLVTGCGHVPAIDRTVQNFSRKGTNPDQYPLSAAQIDALPYAALGVQFQGGSKAVMVLATVNGETLQWASANQAIIETEQGTIVRTRGFDRNLLKTTWDLPNPLATLVAGGRAPAAVYRRIDVGNPDRFEKSVRITSSFSASDAQTIDILGTSHSVIRIDEKADVKAWRWQARNTFWVGVDDQQIWRSKQQFSPEQMPITTELLSRYTPASG